MNAILAYRGTSLVRNRHLVGPGLGSLGALGGWAFSYGRGTPCKSQMRRLKGTHQQFTCITQLNLELYVEQTWSRGDHVSEEIETLVLHRAVGEPERCPTPKLPEVHRDPSVLS